MAFHKLNVLLVCLVATAAKANDKSPLVTSADYPICQTNGFETNEKVVQACASYCDNSTIGSVATSFGGASLGLRLNALHEKDDRGKGLCDSPQLESKMLDGKLVPVTCTEPVLSKIQHVFDNLRENGGIIDKIAALQTQISGQVEEVEKDFQPKFVSLMSEFPEYDVGEPMKKSMDLVHEFEKGYESETRENMGQLKDLVEQLETVLKDKMQTLNEYVKFLGAQASSCNMMINTKQPKVLCRRAKGPDEFSHCCCRSNGLTTMGGSYKGNHQVAKFASKPVASKPGVIDLIKDGMGKAAEALAGAKPTPFPKGAPVDL